MVQVLTFKRFKKFKNKELINDIINGYGDYPNDSFITDDLCKMFAEWYKEQR